MDLGDKVFWFVLFAGIASAVVFVALKLGEVVVRRRTDALIAAHSAGGDDKDEEGEEKPPES